MLNNKNSGLNEMLNKSSLTAQSHSIYSYLTTGIWIDGNKKNTIVESTPKALIHLIRPVTSLYIRTHSSRCI